MGRYKSWCDVLEHDAAAVMLQDNLIGVLGFDAGRHEAVKDYLEQGQNARDYKEVLEKIASRGDEFDVNAYLLEGSRPQTAEESNNVSKEQFKRAVKLSTKEVSELQTALVSGRVKAANEKLGTKLNKNKISFRFNRRHL